MPSLTPTIMVGGNILTLYGRTIIFNNIIHHTSLLHYMGSNIMRKLGTMEGTERRKHGTTKVPTSNTMSKKSTNKRDGMNTILILSLLVGTTTFMFHPKSKTICQKMR